MTCTNRSEFMSGLKSALSKYGISGQQDILQDFEQHFADGEAAGETEAQVCEKLGDPEEIAKQYAPELEAAAAKTQSANTASAQSTAINPAQPAPQQKTGFSPDSSKVAGILIVDFLVLSWAIPALFSLIMALYSVTVGFAVGGLGVAIGGAAMSFVDVSAWFVTGFPVLPTILLGFTMMAGSALLVLASIAATMGFINLIIKIINWHGRVFANKNIFKLIGKKYREEAAK